MASTHCLPALAGAGNNLLIKHIIEKKEWMTQLVRLLAPFDVFFIGVHCALPELERREIERGDRRIGDARMDYETVHTFGVYDLEVDTTQPSEQYVDTIISAWKAWKHPGAFEKMLPSDNPILPRPNKSNAAM